MHDSPTDDWLTAWREGQVEGPDGPLRIEAEHETHTAWVFLTAAHAFKLRKPINLGFLDYSTPEKRCSAASTEVAIGQRISPQVHIGVWSMSASRPPVLSTDGRYGEPVVAMRRLPDALQLERIFSNPDMSAARIDQVASACARFHAGCPVDRRYEGYGAVENTIAAWAINFEQLPQNDATIPLSPEERTQLIEETDRWLAVLRPLLLHRIEEGRIREGHGDLRLQHVYLTDPWSVIDPLEFSIELRFCDVAAEVCFLAMELDDLGRADVAARLLAKYAEATNDRTLPALAPFFKRYRAVVRAKVEWIRSGQTSGKARAAHRAAARRLFELALTYRAFQIEI
jgi:aminoglycoside phosphotransferase family enzyme